MPFRDSPMDRSPVRPSPVPSSRWPKEFRGIFSLETIERYVNASVDRLSGARVVDFIPLFVHRFSREQLRALAQSEGAIIKEVPRSCSSASACEGVLKARVCRGRPLSSAAMASSAA